MLNKYGEVADFCYPVDQFGKSPDACGPYASGYIKYMGFPGKGPSGTPTDIDNWSQLMYERYVGADILTNTNGTNLSSMYRMLADVGADPFKPIAFLQVPATVASIKASIALGRPVVVMADETGMHDADNGNKVDYAWTPTGSHIITVTSVRTSDGALGVRDPANIGATGQRGSGPAATHDGPLYYSASLFGPIGNVISILTPWELQGLIATQITPAAAALHMALAPFLPVAQAILTVYAETK